MIHWPKILKIGIMRFDSSKQAVQNRRLDEAVSAARNDEKMRSHVEVWVQFWPKKSENAVRE